MHLYQVDVQPGDVVVLATDGLYDNMFDEEIARLCGDATQRRRVEQEQRGGAPMLYMQVWIGQQTSPCKRYYCISLVS